MRKLKLVLIATLLAAPCLLLAQSGPTVSPAGPIGLTGNQAILGGETLTITDSDVTLSSNQNWPGTITVVSSVPLTQDRHIYLPLNNGMQYKMQNLTTGGHNLIVGGTTGYPVTIPNTLGNASATFICLVSDGVNYGSCSGSGSGVSTFDQLGGGTSQNKAFVIGPGASITATGGGAITATGLQGPNPYNIYVYTPHAGLTMDNSTPQYGTQVNGNYFSWTDLTNGLSGGPLTINYNRYAGGDWNPFPNEYNDGRTFTPTASDEGTGVLGRYYLNTNLANNYLELFATINAATPLHGANGPVALTLAQTNFFSIAGTYLIDYSQPQTNTATGYSGLQTSNGSVVGPSTITLANSVAVSSTGTLTTDLCQQVGSGPYTCSAWNSSVDPQPVLTTFVLNSSHVLVPGDRVQFVDTNPNLAEATTIVSAPTGATGAQTVTAYLEWPHYPNTPVYINGLAGYMFEATSDTHAGQQYLWNVYGSPTANTILVGSRCIGAVYCTYAGSSGEAVKLYPAATIVANVNPASGVYDSTYALIVPPNGSFAVGDTVANPGMPNNYNYLEKVQVYLDDPYDNMQGNYFNLSGYGMDWQSAFWELQFGFGPTEGTPVDLLKVSGSQGSVASGFSFPSQLWGSRTIPGMGGSNCALCFYGWDTTDSGAPTFQDIVKVAGPSGIGSLTYNSADNSWTIGSGPINSTGMNSSGAITIGGVDVCTVSGTYFCPSNYDSTNVNITGGGATFTTGLAAENNTAYFQAGAAVRGQVQLYNYGGTSFQFDDYNTNVLGSIGLGDNGIFGFAGTNGIQFSDANNPSNYANINVLQNGDVVINSNLVTGGGAVLDCGVFGVAEGSMATSSTSLCGLQVDTLGDVVAAGSLTSAGLIGPATAPNGDCTAGPNGLWVISGDGHLSFCPANGGTWVTKI